MASSAGASASAVATIAYAAARSSIGNAGNARDIAITAWDKQCPNLFEVVANQDKSEPPAPRYAKIRPSPLTVDNAGI